MPGFTGTVNTTVTSGFSVRASERNCMLQDGYTITLHQLISVLNATGLC